MAERCPRSRPLGLARLMRHRFYLMGRTGWASVRPDPRDSVRGLLFDLALADVAALDRYEDVAAGLYTKEHPSVVLDQGGSRQVLVYYGADESEGGVPIAGYMERVVEAARVAGLPPDYVAGLEMHLARRRP